MRNLSKEKILLKIFKEKFFQENKILKNSSGKKIISFFFFSARKNIFVEKFEFFKNFAEGKKLQEFSPYFSEFSIMTTSPNFDEKILF